MPPCLSILAATALLAGWASAVQGQTVDVIRGRVIGPDSVPIADVSVTATGISGGVSRSARTDRNGRYIITFPNGEGDYLVYIAAIGFAPRRFQVKRIADEEVLIANAKLEVSGVVLDPLIATVQRQLPNRNERPPDVSGTEQPINSSVLPPADLGDLAAMAATLPGVTLVPGSEGDPNGFSVLGLGADQNNITLNGMSFGGMNLPRDAMVSSSLITSPFDVSRGGFSGGQLNLTTRSGSNFVVRGMSLNLDAPPFQWTDRAARSLGQEYTNASLGGVVSGPITFNKAFYNISYQLGRRASDYQSLLNTDAVGLRAAGVASDSANRLVDILGASGVPVGVGNRSFSSRATDQGSVFGSIDFAPPSSRTGQAFNLTFNGTWNRQDPLGGSATALPASSGKSSGWNGGARARHNAYLGFLLTETSAAVNVSRTTTSPFLELSSGRVRVTSDFDDGTSGVQTLAFGGSLLNSRQRNLSLSGLNHLSWFSGNNTHRLRLTSEIRYDRYASEQAGNLYGTFTYNSLADLETNLPTSFTRTLSPRESEGSRVAVAFSLGDVWRATERLQIQYGVRLDGNHYFDRPDPNPAVQEIFGVRNDQVPNGLYLSPRAGFSWSYGRAPQVSAFAGAARLPRATVRGGVGLFQNVPGAGLLAQALNNTGLPSAVQQLSCVGPAVPIPDWTAYAEDPASIPTVCADGTAGTVFADQAPSVSLFALDYRPSGSLRANLQWSGPVLGNRFAATIEGTYSRNLNQVSGVDLNFNPTSRFSLAEEAGRPVFVLPTSIVPSTGAIASRDARVSPQFSRVTETRTDLSSESKQLTLRLAPATFSTSFGWSLSYVLSDVRQQSRGFTSTVGNPLEVEWASGFTSRHQIVYTLSYNLFNTVRINWYGQFRSGTRYTPMVATDVNGDGYANDRAFVFDPATAGDPALSSAMQTLLTSGPRSASECLRDQLGRLAPRNSCVGPWTATSNLSIQLNPLKLRMPQRASLSFNLSNPLGAADLLLHGSSGLRGWGQSIPPDGTLLFVRGFDPATQRYQYEVNPRFGSSRPANSAFRVPVTLTAMVRFDIGPMRERQNLTMQLDRGRRTEGTKLPEPLLKAIYGLNVVPNPMAQILVQQDSLKLRAEQADSVATMNRVYLGRLDSIWTPVAKYLAELPDSYDRDEAWKRYLTARRATIDLLMNLSPHLKALLTSEQLRMLPSSLAAYLDPRYLASIRSGTATFAGSGGMPAQAAAGVPVFMGAGGGAAIIDVRRP
ncbi:MAG: carboxypeptidase regulatory-like domain-containing protein [Gemmatimonadales bacterium]